MCDALWFYKRVLKKDPLGMIFGEKSIWRSFQKDDILYLDIGRWLKKNEKIAGNAAPGAGESSWLSWLDSSGRNDSQCQRRWNSQYR